MKRITNKIKSSHNKSVRKFKKQKGGDMVSDVTKQFFPEEDFNIIVQTYDAGSSDEVTTYTITNKDDPKKKCVVFRLDRPNILHIENIYKCKISGNDILERIKDLSERLKKSKITLIDESQYVDAECKEFKINMKLLFILATGQTWYNSKGYNNEQNISSIVLPVLSKNFLEFLRECVELSRRKALDENSLIKLKASLRVPKLNVQDWEEIKSKSTDEEIAAHRMKRFYENEQHKVEIIQFKLDNIEENIKQVNELHDHYYDTYSDNSRLRRIIKLREPIDTITVQDFFKLVKDKLVNVKSLKSKNYKCSLYEWANHLLKIVDNSGRIPKNFGLSYQRLSTK